MKRFNRRNAVKLATLLAVGGGQASMQGLAAEELKSGDLPGVDSALERALENPSRYMFNELPVFELVSDGHSRDLYFTSARDVQGQKIKVAVPSMCTRFFRADTSPEAFTQQGGVYWSFGKTDGKIQFQQPGALVMVVREQNTVRCYSLMPDLRC
jgi:hypothetical protein